MTVMYSKILSVIIPRLSSNESWVMNKYFNNSPSFFVGWAVGCKAPGVNWWQVSFVVCMCVKSRLVTCMYWSA